MARIASVSTFSTFLVAACLAVAPAHAQGLEDRLPDETFLYFHADPSAMIEGARDLDLSRLLRNEEMREFLAPLFEQTPFLSPDDPIGSLLASSPALDYVAGPVSFGLAGIGFEVEYEDGSTEVLRVSPDHPLRARLFHQLASYYETAWVDGEHVVVKGTPPFRRLIVDFLLEIEPGPKLRQIVHDYLRNPPHYAEIGEVRIDGRGVTAINARLPMNSGIITTVYADLSGDRWLIGGDQESFARALSGGPNDPLSRSPSFSEFEKRVASGRNVLLAYADLKTALRLFSTCVSPIVQEELDILGLSAFRGVGFGVSMVEGSVRESMLIAYDGTQPGVFSVLDCLGGGFSSLMDAPATTGAFFGVRFDANRLKDSLLLLVSRLAPRMRSQAEEWLSQAEVEGWNVVNDILPALGGEFSVFASPARYGPIPDVVLNVDVRDAERFARILEFVRDVAEREGGVVIDPLKLKGEAGGYVVRIPDGPVQPAFALLDGRLIGAISAPTLKTYLSRHAENPDSPTLGQSSEVARRILRGLVGDREQSLAMLAYFDLHSTLPVIYELTAPAAQGLFDEAGLPLDAAMMPLAETLQPYFTGVAFGVTRDEGGLGIHLYSPCGLVPGGLMGAMAAWIAEGAPRQGDSD